MSNMICRFYGGLASSACPGHFRDPMRVCGIVAGSLAGETVDGPKTMQPGWLGVP